MITLATLEQATAKEVFEQIKNHMLTQNKKCQLVEHGVCAYRNEEGLKCAAGCLIADNEYSEKMEKKSWETLVLDGRVPRAHYKLICALQSVHDTTKLDLWFVKLKEIEQNLSDYE